MYHEKKTFLINLKSRPDRLNFMKIKLDKIGFNLNNINIIEAIDGKNNIECKKIYKNVKSKNIKCVNTLFQPIKSLGAVGLLLTYRNIINDVLNKDLLNKDLDYIILMEDDNYFHPIYIKKIKEIPSLIKKYDVIYLGSNQIVYTKKQLNEIKNNKDYELENSPISGTFYIVLSKKMIEILKTYFNNNIYDYPIDVLINKIIILHKIKTCVMNPKVVIPEVRDSDNNMSRNHIDFYNNRQMTNFKDYDYFNCFNLFSKDRFIKFNDFIKGKNIIKKNINYCLEGYSLNETRNILLCGNNIIEIKLNCKNKELALTYLNKQTFELWSENIEGTKIFFEINDNMINMLKDILLLEKINNYYKKNKFAEIFIIGDLITTKKY